MPKILNQKLGNLTETDLLELLRLLGKAGYTVRKGRERPPGKQSGAWTHFISFEEGEQC